MMPTGYTISDILTFISIVLLSGIVPLGVWIGRDNVRIIRRDIVRQLESLFGFAEVHGQPLIIPTFELVKYKIWAVSQLVV